jgi:putative toxin-antitoxin system antitoxin component (TIGR02293 family)
MNKKQTKLTRIKEDAVIYSVRPDQEARADEAAGRIRQGLAVDEFEALSEMLELPAEAFAAVLGISRSTFMRRRKAGRLDMQESDRLVRYARLFGQAVHVLGSEPSAARWMKRPARALGGEAPLQFAETEPGAREVERLLGRIEHGVFS